MDGILLVDKPLGWTSFDVVAKIRGLLKSQTKSKVKVGHIGTLDPLASGLLVLVIGSYTKRAGEMTKLDKLYEASLCLGQTSSTGDNEGEKKVVSSKRPTPDQIKKVLKSYLGSIEQLPPAYSAIKIDGQRAYKLIRKGITPKLSARRVHIYSLEATKYDYPTLDITTKVSSGTYIRSLAADIGESLGVGAYLSRLVRRQIGHFDLADAIAMADLSADQIGANLKLLG